MKFQTEQGEITISSEVFTNITGAAATNCYGVKGMAVRSKADGLVHLSPDGPQLRRHCARGSYRPDSAAWESP